MCTVPEPTPSFLMNQNHHHPKEAFTRKAAMIESINRHQKTQMHICIETNPSPPLTALTGSS